VVTDSVDIAVLVHGNVSQSTTNAVDDVWKGGVLLRIDVPALSTKSALTRVFFPTVVA